jgi:hypothetical protein
LNEYDQSYNYNFNLSNPLSTTTDSDTYPFTASPELLMREVEALFAMNEQLNEALEQQEGQSRDERDALLSQIALLRSECDDHVHSNALLSSELEEAQETLQRMTQSLLEAKQLLRETQERSSKEGKGVAATWPTKGASPAMKLDLSELEANGAAATARSGEGSYHRDALTEVLLACGSVSADESVSDNGDALGSAGYGGGPRRLLDRDGGDLLPTATRSQQAEMEVEVQQLRESVRDLQARLAQAELERAAGSSRMAHLERVESQLIEEFSSLRLKEEAQRYAVTKLQGQVGWLVT